MNGTEEVVPPGKWNVSSTVAALNGCSHAALKYTALARTSAVWFVIAPGANRDVIWPWVSRATQALRAPTAADGSAAKSTCQTPEAK